MAWHIWSGKQNLGIRAGDHDAPAKLAELIYRELHQMAARLMRQERSDHTLQPTALLNEALLRLLQTEVLAQAHPAGVNMLYADGSVRVINYWVDPAVHRRAGDRR